VILAGAPFSYCEILSMEIQEVAMKAGQLASNTARAKPAGVAERRLARFFESGRLCILEPRMGTTALCSGNWKPPPVQRQVRLVWASLSWRSAGVSRHSRRGRNGSPGLPMHIMIRFLGDCGKESGAEGVCMATIQAKKPCGNAGNWGVFIT